MTEIIDALDDFINDRYSIYSKKAYGFCELVHKTSGSGGAEETFPITIPDYPDTTRVKVSIDDRYNLITWMRWAQPVTYEVSEDFSFGKTEARMGTFQIRLIFAHKTLLGEDLVFDLVNSLPSTLTVSGFRAVWVNPSPSIDPDHEAIWQTEFGGISAYEKHRFTWNLYVVNITVQFLECEELTP